LRGFIQCDGRLCGKHVNFRFWPILLKNSMLQPI
jgi:hypothetical protein